MRVEWAVACRFAEVHDNLATLVGAGIDQQIVPRIPGHAQVMFVVRLAAPPADAGKSIEFRARILDPNMNATGDDLVAQVGIPPQVHREPGWEGHVMLPMAVTFEVVEAGTHTVVFEADGSSTQVPLIVRART